MLNLLPNYSKKFKGINIQCIYALFILSAFSLNTYATQNASATHTKNEALASSLLNLKEVGKARFSVFLWDVYDSRLLTNTGLYPHPVAEQQTVVLEIKYLRDIKQKDLIANTIEQWQHLNIPESTYQTYIPLLENIWPDINAGDSLAIKVTQNKSIFYYNSNFLGDISHQNNQAHTLAIKQHFGQLFLDIWLSPATSEPKLRKQLLNIASHNNKHSQG